MSVVPVCVCVHCVARRPRARITSGGSERVVVVEDGQRLQLRCRADGRPRPDVTWLKDGQTLHNDDTRHIRRTRSALLAPEPAQATPERPDRGGARG